MERSSSKRTNRPLVLTLALLLGLALTAGSLPFAAQPARAANLTVNTVGDGGDIQPGDGVCDASTNPGAQCSLRAALQVAEDTFGADTISFNIPGGGLKTISPNSPLPEIISEVTIDGYTQPGSKPNTATTGTNAALMIELDGSDAGFATGLVVSNASETGANSVLIRGLVINRFRLAGVDVTGTATGTRIVGCFIGTDASGTADRGNTLDGVQISNANNVTIGGADPATRNLISGNGQGGIELDGEATNVQVLGNLIGTDRTGAGDLGNGTNGVFAAGSATIGGATPGHPNTIAFNGGDGVSVAGGSGNRVLVNSIYANGGLGIDLGGNGRTPNDQQDPDPGANFLQNFPVITSATPNRVSGTLNSNPNRTFTLRLFSNPGGNEGRDFAGGPVTVTTDANGNASFVFKPTTRIPAGRTVTATATRTDGNTSEFSNPKIVTRS